MVLVSCIGARGDPAAFVARIFWAGKFPVGRGKFLRMVALRSRRDNFELPHPNEGPVKDQSAKNSLNGGGVLAHF